MGIDAVGIGAGVVDNLKAAGYMVTEISGGNKPEQNIIEETFKPFNLRSQMYYELRKDLIAGSLTRLIFKRAVNIFMVWVDIGVVLVKKNCVAWKLDV